jgi:hypothetical protein
MCFIVTRHADHLHRWELRFDGRTIPQTGDGYPQRDQCVAAIKIFKALVGGASISDDTDGVARIIPQPS